jgi:hypothetical protein
MLNKSPESGSGQARKSKRTQNVPRIMFARPRLVKLQEIAWLSLNSDGKPATSRRNDVALTRLLVDATFPAFPPPSRTLLVTPSPSNLH